MADSSDGWDRLARFRRAADDGLDDREIRLFERELSEEASSARFRRGLSVGMGIALVIASGLIFGLTAAGEIEETVGATIGIGTTIVGIMSLNPRVLRTSMDFYSAIMYGGSPLSRGQRELLAVVVSRANHCRY